MHLQGVSKGGMVDRVLADVTAKGDCPDFVLCIGDDRSDEDMFLAMEHVTFSPHMPAEVSSPSHLILSKSYQMKSGGSTRSTTLRMLAKMGACSRIENLSFKGMSEKSGDRMCSNVECCSCGERTYLG